jgi:hypothetical protein
VSNYDNTNKGTIAKNARKETDQHPDIAGSINVNGTDYWLNGWLKTNSRDGSKFYSLSVKPKQERAAEIRRAEPRREQGIDLDGPRNTHRDDDLDGDSIPF